MSSPPLALLASPSALLLLPPLALCLVPDLLFPATGTVAAKAPFDVLVVFRFAGRGEVGSKQTSPQGSLSVVRFSGWGRESKRQRQRQRGMAQRRDDAELQGEGSESLGKSRRYPTPGLRVAVADRRLHAQRCRKERKKGAPNKCADCFDYF